MPDYIHARPGTETTCHALTYTIISDGRLRYHDRELLYIEGVTIAGSACCGAVECRVIHVPGLIVSWKHKVDSASGNPISEIEPVDDPECREDIRKLLFRSFPSSLFILAP